MDADLNAQARIADDIEAAAYRDMYAAAPNELVRAFALRSMDSDGATILMANGIPDPVFSRVIGLGNRGNFCDEQIDTMIAAYRQAGISRYWVHINPIVAPNDFPWRLEQRGFRAPKRRSWAKMIRDAEPAPQIDTDLTVRLAATREHVTASQAIATAFGMPPPFALWVQNMAARASWTLVIVLDDSRIVGGGLLYIENKLAWLGLGGVLPDARRRNAHRGMMALRIAIAVERGCTHIVTETGEPMNNEPNPSLRNMYRCGFTRVCSRLNLASPN